MDRFHWADYVVFVGMLTVSAGVGVFYGIKDRKKSSVEEFLVGGRSMHVLPVSVSLFVSIMSAIAFLGDPVEVYNFGGLYTFLILGAALVYPIIAQIFAPFFQRMNLLSAFEYLESRYNKYMRRMAAIIQIMTVMIWMGIVLYAPSLALSQVSGMPVWVAIIGVGGICTFYTTLGGIKAEVWADTLQLFIMLVGLIALLACGANKVGGIGKAMEIAKKGGRWDLSNFNLNPLEHANAWNYLLGGFFRTMVPYIATQVCVQKYCTLSTAREASLAVYLNLPIYIICSVLFLLIGMVMYAVYHDCDPLMSGRIKAPDQMVPLMVMDVLGFLPGIPGLFVSALFSASLSTIASGLNALAANILSDILRPWHLNKYGKPIPDHLGTRICKIIAIVMGVITILLAFVVLNMGSSVFVITTKMIGMVASPVLGLFLLGIMCPTVDSLSAFCGFLFSLVICCWWGLAAMAYGFRPHVLPRSIHGCPVPLPTNSLNGTVGSNFTSPAANTAAYFTEAVSSDDGFAMYSVTDAPLVLQPGGGMHFTDIYRWSAMLYPALGTLLTLFVALGVSFVRGLWRQNKGLPAHRTFLEENKIPTYRDMRASMRGERSWKRLEKGKLVEQSVQFPSIFSLETAKEKEGEEKLLDTMELSKASSTESIQLTTADSLSTTVTTDATPGIPTVDLSATNDVTSPADTTPTNDVTSLTNTTPTNDVTSAADNTPTNDVTSSVVGSPADTARLPATDEADSLLPLKGENGNVPSKEQSSVWQTMTESSI